MAQKTQLHAEGTSYEPYRRGDLRQAFIDAALVMVRERGEEGFSLNELARKLGVSAGAAYRHFANKEALLSTVCASGYRQLGEILDAELDPGMPAGERVLALGLRYVQFAEQNSDIFGMMFGTRSLDIDAVGADTFRPLVSAVEVAQAHSLLPAGDARVVSGAVWMALHGLTVLHINGRLATLELDGTPTELITRYLGVQFPLLAQR